MIARGRDAAAVAEAAAELPSMVVALHDADVPAAAIGRMMSGIHDSIVRRLIELAQDELGAPPVPWTWLATGSYAPKRAVPELGRRLGGRLGGRRRRPGAPRAPARRGAKGRGRAGSERLPHRPTGGGRHAPAVRPLGRGVAAGGRGLGGGPGPRSRADALQRRGRERRGMGLHGRGRSHRGGVRPRPRPRADAHPPRRCGAGGAASHGIPARLRPPLDRRAEGGARHQAAAGSSRSSRSRDGPASRRAWGRRRPAARLRAAEAGGALEAADAAVLRDAFEFVCALRMEHQVEQLRAGKPPDDLVAPKSLPPLTRTSLKEAFRAVARVQRGVGVRLGLSGR